jgi:MFS family permease
VDSWRGRLLEMPTETLKSWKWDMLGGLCAGVYQGSVWTFVGKVARHDLQATESHMAWIAAAPALGYLFATLWARQMEGKAKMPFVYWTWLIARGLFIATPAVASAGQFTALVCITPFIFSVSTPAYAAVMKDIYPDHQRGRLMSVVRIGTNSMMLIASLVFGRLMDHGLDFRYSFLVGGIFGALSAVAFSRIRVPASPTGFGVPIAAKAFAKDTYDILRRNPGFRWFSFSVFMYGFGNIVSTTLYPMFQVDRLHVSNTEVANLQNVASIMTIVGFFFWGGFLDTRGPLATVMVAMIVVTFMPLCYMAAKDVSLLYVAAALGGVALSGIELGYLNTTLLFAEPGKAAQYQALHSSFFGIRGSIAPFCAVPLFKWLGFRGAFSIGLTVCVIGVVLQAIAMRDYRREAGAAGRA